MHRGEPTVESSPVMAPEQQAAIEESLLLHSAYLGIQHPTGADIAYLGQGTVNFAFKAALHGSTGSRLLVVRTPHDHIDNASALMDYNNELRIRTEVLPADFPYQPTAHYVGSSPRPYMVEDYMPGEHPPSDFSKWTPPMVRALGRLAASVHKYTEQPLPHSPPRDSAEMLRHRYRQITQPTLDLAARTPAEDYIASINQALLERLQTVAGNFIPADTHALGHFDMTLGNIIISPYGSIQPQRTAQSRIRPEPAAIHSP